MMANGGPEKEDRYVIAQFPNPPLWVMLGAWILGRLTSGAAESIFSTVFYIAGVIWAYEEIASGVNLFRRVLGLTVMIVLGYGIFNAIT